MNKFLLLFILFLGLLSIDKAHAQLPHCCKNKVHIRKQRKRAPGALVGVKGKNDNRSYKRQEKDRAKAYKEAERKKKLAAKEEKEKAAQKVKDSIANIGIKDKKPKKPLTTDEKVQNALDEIFKEEEKNLEDE